MSANSIDGIGDRGSASAFQMLSEIILNKRPEEYQQFYHTILSQNYTQQIFYFARLVMGFIDVNSYDSIFDIPVGFQGNINENIPEIINALDGIPSRKIVAPVPSSSTPQTPLQNPISSYITSPSGIQPRSLVFSTPPSSISPVKLPFPAGLQHQRHHYQRYHSNPAGHRNPYKATSVDL